MEMKEIQNLTGTFLIDQEVFNLQIYQHCWARAVTVISDNMLYQNANEDNEHKHTS